MKAATPAEVGLDARGRFAAGPGLAVDAVSAPLDDVELRALAAISWPAARLGEALDLLARRAGLQPQTAPGLTLPAVDAASAPNASNASNAASTRSGPETARWLDWAAAQLGIELEAVDTPVPELSALVAGAGPALLRWTDAQGVTAYLLLLGRSGGRLRMLAPDLRVRRTAPQLLVRALRWAHEADGAPEVDDLMHQAAVPARRRAAVRAALLRDRLAGTRVQAGWLLRLPPSAPAWTQLRHAGLPQRVVWMVAALAALYGLEIGAWTLIGEGVLDGRLDRGWLSAWLLLLLAMLPLQLLAGWFNSSFTMGAARLLKTRLLAGALRMDPDVVRRQGVGGLLGRVLESQALESLALGGAMAVVVGALELTLAGWVLAQGAAPLAHGALLLGWLGVTLGLLLRWWRRQRSWTLSRLALTHELIEQMVGHRTRLAQERVLRRDARDDALLHGHLQQSAAMDAAAVPLQTVVPSGWIVVALAALAPVFASGQASAVGLAISLGGVLLAQRALGSMAGGLSSLGRAVIAWQQVGEMVRAGAGQDAPGAWLETPMTPTAPMAPTAAMAPKAPTAAMAPKAPVDPAAAPTGPSAAALVDAQGLRFAHGAGAPVLQGVDLRIAAGERVLLEGASGSGKSTLAALLAGLRQPQSGLLLLQGLDAPTLGTQWQALATAAPQFHENHVLSGSVAFNLLMGHEWPAGPAALAEAQAVCEALGLGDLLQRMPGGLHQRVGETGWQLSHGERSRLFLARALLQGAPLTVLDESFAALDPETLARCLRAVQQRTQTLVLIAHP
jgi:ATP-binding cassette, subfamily B, bacterial